MNDSPLVFFLIAGLFLLIGLSGLRSEEIYLGRLIRFVGPKLVLRARLSVLIHGVLISLAGVMAVVVAIAKIFDPETALVNQVMPLSLIVFGAGFFGSMVVELIYYSTNTGPYADVDPEDVAHHYRGPYR